MAVTLFPSSKNELVLLSKDFHYSISFIQDFLFRFQIRNEPSDTAVVQCYYKTLFESF